MALIENINFRWLNESLGVTCDACRNDIPAVVVVIAAGLVGFGSRPYCFNHLMSSLTNIHSDQKLHDLWL